MCRPWVDHEVEQADGYGDDSGDDDDYSDGGDYGDDNGDDDGDDDGGWPVVGVGGECDVAGEDDDKLGEREVHQQPVYRGSELKGFEMYKKLRII